MLNARLQQALLNALPREDVFLSLLKEYAARRGMRFKERRRIALVSGCGQRIEARSPYFTILKTKKSAQGKKGPNGGGRHLGLDVLGFIGRVSPGLLSDALQTSLLCPSYEVARTVLAGRGVDLGVKTLRRLCRTAGKQDKSSRARLALSGEENLQGGALVISPDGGRLRERKRKRGRKPDRLKRQGYRADWREPKLFTIYLTDGKGNLIKSFKPAHDATMENHEGMFELSGSYLRRLRTDGLERIVFCGDGGAWIRDGAAKLCKRTGFAEDKVYQAIDYTRARQNLQEIIERVVPDKQKATAENWRYLLWNGEFDALERSVRERVTGKKNRESALKKFENCFAANREKMQYARFKAQGLPCGSGRVESAIRRAINLRLKAPGTFWLKDRAECFLYLRSQLISGRREIFTANLTSLMRREFRSACIPEACSLNLPDAA